MAVPSPASVNSTGKMLENTTPERQLRRNERRLTVVNCSYRTCSLRNDLAMLMPLTVSCTWALTSATARRAWVTTSRARRRKPSAAPITTGTSASVISVSTGSTVNR